MSDVFSDSRSEPSPALAQLLLLTSAELLELTVPERTRGEITEHMIDLEVEPQDLPARTRKCSQCGATYAVPPKGRVRLTCSDTCHIAATNHYTQTLPCRSCGKPVPRLVLRMGGISKRSTCSDACMGKLNNKTPRANPCAFCGVPFLRKRFKDGKSSSTYSQRKTCSDACQTAFRLRTISLKNKLEGIGA